MHGDGLPGSSSVWLFMCSYINEEHITMKTVLDEPGTQTNADIRAQNRRCQDEEELERRIEKGINDAKAAVSEKLEDGKAAAERFLRQGRYAVEDRLSELTHTIKRNPISSLGFAFAAGAAVGLLLSLCANRSETASNQ
jgi:ElaB/YqjD/DUF883 family membrane-anchored ribosome-binding protein